MSKQGKRKVRQSTSIVSGSETAALFWLPQLVTVCLRTLSYTPVVCLWLPGADEYFLRNWLLKIQGVQEYFPLVQPVTGCSRTFSSLYSLFANIFFLVQSVQEYFFLRTSLLSVEEHLDSLSHSTLGVSVNRICCRRCQCVIYFRCRTAVAVLWQKVVFGAPLAREGRKTFACRHQSQQLSFDSLAETGILVTSRASLRGWKSHQLFFSTNVRY